MQGGVSDYLVILLALALIAAAVGDLRTRTIPNWLTLAIALSAIPFWWAADLSLWPDVAWRIGIAFLVFAIFAGAFALGMMGGGDVKLAAALALWFPPAATLKFLVLMSIAGGVLTLALLVWHKAKRREGRPEIPYGVAIAFGGLAILTQRFLNQFA